LGLLTFVFVLIMKFRHFDRKRIILLFSTLGITVILTVIPLRDLIFSRLSNQAIATETISSVGRSWLAQQAMDIIQKHPLNGVGVGSFIIELATNAVEGAPIEPVHNVFLLVMAELGVVGLILLLGLIITIAYTIIRSKSPQAILAGALVTGLGVINLFDHYLWTLAPGRLMLGLALGLWAGQVAHDA
jgi:O-antigen ligase